MRLTMERVAIVGASRTPIGKLGGALASLSADQLGTIVIQAALNRAHVNPDQVDEVYLGCAIQAGAGQNVARQAAVNAGIPYSVPATTINVMCGSGLQAINLAAKMIQYGDADVMVAGGTESMSNAPYLIPKGRFGYKYGNAELIDAVYHDGLEDAFYHYPMGITAENLVQQYGITREQLDRFALESQRRAQAAQQAGRFKNEIVPVTLKTKHGSKTIMEDEAIRETSLGQLANLKAAFLEDGVVTAGNSSGINDGAAALVLMKESQAKTQHLSIMGYWEAGKLAGVDPQVMGIGPLVATKKVLETTNLTVDQLDLVELNEAFAAQSLIVKDQLNLPDDKVNVNGGAIALGHPLGDSGARIVVTLLYEMQRRQVNTGLATLCIGGGMGIAAIFNRI
ncbi:Acetyl-CoA acetyltransferase [Limosilactobacillus gastricus PS3]|uniref:acetyl-CoA C-acetyltransferase n=2 Tax=Limosilactobacillus gastricus TaxID=227942 RepID=H4GIZ6_9LACO|nr:Acetyl-CoA acetyltransferase [Limosilactobacillus gastricus PS3]